MKVEAVYFLETLVPSYQSLRRHNPEENNMNKRFSYVIDKQKYLFFARDTVASLVNVVCTVRDGVVVKLGK
jgi:hypothetical protein